MTLQEEYRLSIYEELTSLGTHNNIKLVKNTVTNHLCVKKTLTSYKREVYDTLREQNIQGIPAIYEIIEDDGCLIVIEDYIQGQTLDQRYPGKNSVSTVVDIVKALCRILEKLHQLDPPIIHRDIKPENIIVSSDGYLYLTDFNISREYVPDQDRDTIIMGTSGYAAPEQCGYAQTDARSDIYSVGMLMKHLLQMDEPEDEEEFRMDHIIHVCTSLDPDKRYHDVTELIACIDGKTSPQTDSSTSSGWRTYLPPGFRSGKWYKMLVAIVGYICIIAMSMEMSMEDTDPVQQMQQTVAIRIAVFLTQILTVAIWFDWRGLRDRLPIINHSHTLVRSVGYILYPISILFMMLVIAVLVTGLI